MKRTAALAGGVALAVLGVSVPAVARDRHHHRAQAAREVPPAPVAYSYYPQSIEGGSTGNLPFNNQIRKLRDPLNANGGK